MLFRVLLLLLLLPLLGAVVSATQIRAVPPRRSDTDNTNLILKDMLAKLLNETRSRPSRKRADTFETEMRGANYNLKYCEGSHDMEALIKDVLPPANASQLRPHVTIDVDEMRGLVRFRVEVPYVPFDSRWNVAFHPLARDPAQRARQHAAPSECSLLFEGGDATPASSSSSSSTSTSRDSPVRPTQDRRGWAHAPNAKYRNAFSSPIDYPANFVPPESAWSAEPKGCSHVVYAAEFTVAQLAECRDPSSDALHTAGLLALADDEVRALTSSLYVSLSLPSAANYAEYRFDASLTVDKHESKALLVDEVDATLPLQTRLRHVYVDDEQHLQIVLQTSLQGALPANLSIISIAALDHSSTFQLTSSRYFPAYHYERGIYLQNWYLSSTTDADLFEGHFTLLFADRSDSDRHHATRLSLYVANPRAVDFTHQPLHSEITQHNDTFEDQRQHIGAFEDGNRACMQTYIIGSNRVSRLMQLILVEAWLCTAANDEVMMAEDASSLLCAAREHSVKLFGPSAGTRAVADYGVTVHQPGAYGPLSVAVCFNTNSAFRDDRNRTLTHPNQRYESRVMLKSAAGRRGAALTDAAPSMYAQLGARTDALQRTAELQVRRVDLLDAQSVQKASFTPFKFQQSLDEARRLGLTTETHAHVFRVARAGKQGSISSSEATAIVIAMIATGLMVFCCFICVSWYTKKKHSETSTRSRLDQIWRNRSDHIVQHD